MHMRPDNQRRRSRSSTFPRSAVPPPCSYARVAQWYSRHRRSAVRTNTVRLSWGASQVSATAPRYDPEGLGRPRSGRTAQASRANSTAARQALARMARLRAPSQFHGRRSPSTLVSNFRHDAESRSVRARTRRGVAFCPCRTAAASLTAMLVTCGGRPHARSIPAALGAVNQCSSMVSSIFVPKWRPAFSRATRT